MRITNSYIKEFMEEVSGIEVLVDAELEALNQAITILTSFKDVDEMIVRYGTKASVLRDNLIRLRDTKPSKQSQFSRVYIPRVHTDLRKLRDGNPYDISSHGQNLASILDHAVALAIVCGGVKLSEEQLQAVAATNVNDDELVQTALKVFNMQTKEFAVEHSLVRDLLNQLLDNPLIAQPLTPKERFALYLAMFPHRSPHGYSAMEICYEYSDEKYLVELSKPHPEVLFKPHNPEYDSYPCTGNDLSNAILKYYYEEDGCETNITEEEFGNILTVMDMVMEKLYPATWEDEVDKRLEEYSVSTKAFVYV